MLSKQQQQVVDWLQNNFEGQYSVSFTESNEIIITGDISLINYQLTELPYKFKYVYGSFSVGGHKFPTIHKANNHLLKTLKNCPELVTGDFNCALCSGLISLQGGPLTVQGNYYCHNTGIKSLDGIANTIGKSIILYCNKDLSNIEALASVTDINLVDLTGLQDFIYGSEIYQTLYDKKKLMQYDYSIHRYDYNELQKQYKEVNNLI